MHQWCLEAPYGPYTGLFEWSIKQQGDGTHREPSSVRQVSEEERKWFTEAMESQQEDLVKRMKNIKVALDEKDDADEQVLIPEWLCLFHHVLCSHIDGVLQPAAQPDGWANSTASWTCQVHASHMLPPCQVAEKLKLLEDLTEIVESINYARGALGLPGTY